MLPPSNTTTLIIHVHIVSLMSTGIVPVCVVTIVECGYTVAVRTSAQVHTTNYQILAPPGAVTGAISLTIQVLIFILTILKYLTHLISCPDYRRIQTFLLSLPLLVSAQVSAARRSLIPTERIILRTSNLKLLDWAHQVILCRGKLTVNKRQQVFWAFDQWPHDQEPKQLAFCHNKL